MACLLGSLDAEVEDKGEGGEVMLSFAFSGAALDEAIERIGLAPLPPYIAAPARAGRGSRRLPDDLRRRTTAPSRRRPRGFISRPRCSTRIGRPARACIGSRCTSARVPFCPSRRRTPGSRDALGMGRARRRDGRGVECARGGRRAHRRGRHHLGSAARERRRRCRPHPRFAGDTAIFITPGHRFRAVDLLLTNFHLPRSTLLMLVSAFSGVETMQAAYAHAISAAIASIPTATPACSSAPDQAADRAVARPSRSRRPTISESGIGLAKR